PGPSATGAEGPLSAGALIEGVREALEPELERLVADRQAEPRVAGAAWPEPVAWRDYDAVLPDQALEGHPFRELPPDVEGALAGERPEQRLEDLEHAVAPALVDVAPLGDGVLRPGQRGDAGFLDRPEDPSAAVVVEQVDPLDDLRVADDEPDPPARHAVGLGHREHPAPDLLRARSGEEAARGAPVEDEVAVGKVVDDRGAGRLRVGDRLLERAAWPRRGGRGGRVVQVDGGDVLRWRLLEVRRPSVSGIERHVGNLRACERRPRRVVRVVRIGQHDRLSLL